MKEKSHTTEADSSLKLIGTVLSFSLAYAVVRYHIAGDVSWKELPFFIMNKAISLAGFILLSFNFAFGPAKKWGLPLPKSWLDARKTLGMVGFILILIHLFMSFMLFSQSYYGKFFGPDGTLTFSTSMSMLAGILGFIALCIYNLSFQTFLKEDKAFMKFITSRTTMLIAFLFGAIHLFFMGYKGWLNPSGWNGGMPPITMVAIVFFLIAYSLNLKYRE